MTNHPNRNWRRRMADACETYLALWRWRPGEFTMTSDTELRGLMTQAYQAGYTDGRQSIRPARNDRTAI